MTDLQRIEFAAAAMACKRMGLMSHSAPAREPAATMSPCIPGRVRHQYKDGIVCAHCGAPKGGRVPLRDEQSTAN